MFTGRFIFKDPETGETINYWTVDIGLTDETGVMLDPAEILNNPHLAAKALQVGAIVHPYWMAAVFGRQTLLRTSLEDIKKYRNFHADHALSDIMDNIMGLMSIPGHYGDVDIPIELRPTISEQEHGNELILAVDAALQEIYKAQQKKAEREARKTIRKQGYLYVLKALIPDTCYKIGLSSKPVTRINSLGVNLPFPIDPLHVFPTNDMFGCERYLHNKFAGKRVNGEWFQLEQPDLDYLLALSKLDAEDCQ